MFANKDSKAINEKPKKSTKKNVERNRSQADMDLLEASGIENDDIFLQPIPKSFPRVKSKKTHTNDVRTDPHTGVYTK